MKQGWIWIFAQHYRGSFKSLNTGIITLMNYGNDLDDNDENDYDDGDYDGDDCDDDDHNVSSDTNYDEDDEDEHWDHHLDELW